MLKLIVAHLRCFWYLLSYGMWNGQCKFQGWDAENKTTLIAAITGSLQQKTTVVHRVFFNELGIEIPLGVVVEFHNTRQYYRRSQNESRENVS